MKLNMQVYGVERTNEQFRGCLGSFRLLGYMKLNMQALLFDCAIPARVGAAEDGDVFPQELELQKKQILNL
nr:hypothetical protein [Tanacetum cinerariifolium]